MKAPGPAMSSAPSALKSASAAFMGKETVMAEAAIGVKAVPAPLLRYHCLVGARVRHDNVDERTRVGYQ